MVLKVIDKNKNFRDIVIREGEQFLLPSGIPHSPQRFTDTIGLVMEIERPEQSVDVLRWYCPNKSCREIIHEGSFHCVDLGTQLSTAINNYYNDDDSTRTCKKCNTQDSRPVPNSLPDPNVAPHNGNNPGSAYAYDCEENSLPYERNGVSGVVAPSAGHPALRLLNCRSNLAYSVEPSDSKSPSHSYFYSLKDSLVKRTTIAGHHSSVVGQWHISLFEAPDQDARVEGSLNTVGPVNTSNVLDSEDISSLFDASNGRASLTNSPILSSPSSPNLTNSIQEDGIESLTEKTVKLVEFTGPSLDVKLSATGQPQPIPLPTPIFDNSINKSQTQSQHQSFDKTDERNEMKNLDDEKSRLQENDIVSETTLPLRASLSNSDLLTRTKLSHNIISKVTHEKFFIQLAGMTSLRIHDASPAVLHPGDCVLVPKNVKVAIQLQEAGKLLMIHTPDAETNTIGAFVNHPKKKLMKI